MLAYDTAVRAPTLRGTRNTEPDISLASHLLKRCVTDLRATWLLLRIGYTSQAACVAAALWENGLATEVVAGHPERVALVLENRNNKFPWGAKDLAQLWAQDHKATQSPDIRWREAYLTYKWLCRLKHPTWPSLLHDIGPSKKKDGSFIVMALSDIRPEDKGMKVSVGAHAVQRMLGASTTYAFALGLPEQMEPAVVQWFTQTREAMDIICEHFREGPRPALTLDPDDTKILKEYNELKARESDGGAPSGV